MGRRLCKEALGRLTCSSPRSATPRCGAIYFHQDRRNRPGRERLSVNGVRGRPAASPSWASRSTAARVVHAAADGQRHYMPLDERDRLPGSEILQLPSSTPRPTTPSTTWDRCRHRARDRARLRRPGSRYDGTGALRLVDRGGPGAVRRAREASHRAVQRLHLCGPRPKHKVNGASPVGENIGDLGGLQIGYAAYRIATEGHATSTASPVPSDSSSAGRRSGGQGPRGRGDPAARRGPALAGRHPRQRGPQLSSTGLRRRAG